ncbi:MATE family efflux transporter [Clostridium frigidicarnis]|uniref:Multidrug export protein MepA n=1 Tax=Clostridium frigidicarnis TaxID=84698 RepID=A0A1I0YPN4_9CLOT|nr:MATE family efflux transporter [Clostridium frigidicarnis]SFB15162.1 putative efflux protein, MATE family [Clostridium frigidicarnis]
MNKERSYRLANEDVKKLLISFSIPSIVGMLVNALYNIIDRMFIGKIPNVGGLAITGVGLTFPIVTIILAFGMLVGVGAGATVSIRLGQKRSDDAENIVGNALSLVIIINILLSIAGLIFVEPILRLLGASDNTLIFALEYIKIILVGAVFSNIAFSMNNLLRAEGNPKISMITMIFGAILNVILDPIFIFVFDMGIKGGALATVISQMASSAWVLYYYLSGKSVLKIRKKYLMPRLSIVKDIFAIGMAPFAMQIVASVVTTISNRTLNKYGGDAAIGAMTVINSVSMIFLMPIFGINQGAQPIIGFNYGAENYKRVKDTLKYAVIGATTICLLGFVLVQAFPKTIINFFNDDPLLVEIGVKGIRTFLFMLPMIGFQIVGSNFFQSIGKAKTSIFLSLTRQVIFLMPLLVVLPRFLELNGVWFAGPTSDFLASLVTALFLIYEMKHLEYKHQEQLIGEQ